MNKLKLESVMKKQAFKSEEKAFCNRYKSRKASGTDYEFVKLHSGIRAWLENTFMRLSCQPQQHLLNLKPLYGKIKPAAKAGKSNQQEGLR